MAAGKTRKRRKKSEPAGPVVGLLTAGGPCDCNEKQCVDRIGSAVHGRFLRVVTRKRGTSIVRAEQSADKVDRHAVGA